MLTVNPAQKNKTKKVKSFGCCGLPSLQEAWETVKSIFNTDATCIKADTPVTRYAQQCGSVYNQTEEDVSSQQFRQSCTSFGKKHIILVPLLMSCLLLQLIEEKLRQLEAEASRRQPLPMSCTQQLYRAQPRRCTVSA